MTDRWPRRLFRRLRALVRGGALDGELDEELRFHLERETERHVRAGMPPDEARARALREFGPVERLRDECRDARGVRPIEDFVRDLRFGARALRRAPGFTAVVVLTLAIGIGATTTIFAAVDGVLLRPLPYGDPGELVIIWQGDRRQGMAEDDVSPANFLDLRERTRAFSAVAALDPFSLDWMGPDGPVALRTWLVSEELFPLLDVPPLLGRTFGPQDYVLGQHRVVVLGYGTWRDRFGADPGIVGASLRLDGEPWTIVGVMPPEFDLPDDPAFWAPRLFDADDRERRAPTYLNVLARLRPGVTMDAANADLAAISAQLAAEYPRTNADVGFTAVLLGEYMMRRARPALYVLLGAVACVLIIGCVNVANLLLARSVRRERELVIRSALGAGRERIIRQLAAESLLLAILGGAAGVVLAVWGVEAVRLLTPVDLPRADFVRLGGRTLLFSTGLTLGTAVLFGLAPALRLARLDARPAIGAPVATPGRRRHAVHRALVAGEIALAVVLLVGAALLARSFARLLDTDRGFRSHGVLAVTVQAWGYYTTPAQRAAFVRGTLDRIAALPGVRAVGVTSALPLAPPIGAKDARVEVDARPEHDRAQLPVVGASAVSDGFFEALGIALRQGRTFTRADDASAAPVVVINETMARRFWPGANPIGERITVSFGGAPVSREVVGIVGDVRQDELAAPSSPQLYVPHAQSPTGALVFTVRTAGAPLALLPSVREAIWKPNPAMPLSNATTVDAVVADALRHRRFQLVLLATFAATAMLLAAIGIYGVMSYATSERTREIGVRLAMGARRESVVALVVGQGLVVAALGLLMGLAGAAALTRVLGGMLYGVTPLDPIAFGVGALLILIVAAAACVVPGVRAARIDPVRALRAD